MKTAYWWGAGVFLVLVILIVFMVGGADERVIVESGTVELWSGEVWEPIVGEKQIKQGMRLRTQEGEATIILEEMIIVLDPWTEMTVGDTQDIVVETQGSTWNKVLRLAQGSTARVEHPQVVAMVRGTEFGVRDDGLTVAEGMVEGHIGNNITIVNANEKLWPNGTLSVADVNYLRQRMQHTLILLERERMHEIEQHPRLVKTALSISPYETVEAALADIDAGQWTRETLEEQPLYWLYEEKIERAVLLTEKIIEQRKLLGVLE